jgi:hypothetical protein
MELHHLRYFVAVAEELSFTKAAQKLRLAQPSRTRQVRNPADDRVAVLYLGSVGAGSEQARANWERSLFASRREPDQEIPHGHPLDRALHGGRVINETKQQSAIGVLDAR